MSGAMKKIYPKNYGNHFLPLSPSDSCLEMLLQIFDVKQKGKEDDR